MPSCANKNTEKKANNSTVEVSTKTVDNKDLLIEELLKKVESLTNIVNNMTKVEESTNINETESNHVEFNEPMANKQIRIMSLCYGSLNLSTEPNGRGKLYSFSKYGEVKNILYSTLIDIVNINRSFAESGLFYILDKDAVYFLGLSDYYQKIQPKEVLDNIYTYSSDAISDIISNISEEQKYVLARKTIDKVYHEEKVDLGKCIHIGKCCGVDIMAKVSEMKSLEDNMKSSN